MSHPNLKTLTKSLTHYETRALANCIFAPPLLQLQSNGPMSAERVTHSSVPLFTLDGKRSQWLLDLDKNPAPLVEFLQPFKDRRLGLLYERFWNYFLQNDYETELLSSNLAVRSGGRTLGEFDAIYHHRALGTVHLEVAIKFYLAKNQHSQHWENWLGPGKRDRLDLKLNKMIEQQANLLDHEEATQALHDKGINTRDNITRQLHVGGTLFFGSGDTHIENNQPSPTTLNPAMSRGDHLPLKQWQVQNGSNREPFLLIQRQQWLDDCPALGKQSSSKQATHYAEASQQLQNLVLESDTPQMIVQRHQGEFIKRFVTPDNW